MATVYSDPAIIGNNRIRIKCDYSGTSATLSVEFSRVSSGWSDTWTDTSATLTFNGRTASASYYYSGYVDATTWITLATVSGYTVSSSGGTYNWSFNNNPGAVLGCSGTITIPSQGTKPVGVAVTEYSFSYNKGIILDAVVQVSDWGSGSSSSNSLILCVSRTSPPTGLKSITVGTDTQASFNITSLGALSYFSFNTLYYIQGKAQNTVGTTSGPIDTIISLPGPANSINASNIQETSATISWSVSSDGGGATITYLMSLDNGETWSEVGTKTTRTGQTFTKELTGLTKNTTYTVLIRSTSSGGTYTSSSYQFTTLSGAKLYVPGHDLDANVILSENASISDLSKLLANGTLNDEFEFNYSSMGGIEFVFKNGTKIDTDFDPYGVEVEDYNLDATLKCKIIEGQTFVSKKAQKMYTGLKPIIPRIISQDNFIISDADLFVSQTKLGSSYSISYDNLLEVILISEDGIQIENDDAGFLCRKYGLRLTDADVDGSLECVVEESPNYITKAIKKLYVRDANGLTRLIFNDNN